MMRRWLGFLVFGWLCLADYAMADLDDEAQEQQPRKTLAPTPEAYPKKAEPDLGNPAATKKPPPIKPSSPVEPTVKAPATKAPEPATKTVTNPIRPRKGEGHDNTLPITWKAKGFKGTRAGKLIELKQDVEVNQDKMKMTADRADIYFDDSDALSKVHANGNVKIRKEAALPQDRIFARGNEAVFYNAERKVVLKGKALLQRGQDVVRGKQISYDLDTGWITVDSVEGVVQPGETTQP
jgi:lipopolysaccharide transport protein LptA